LGENPLDYCGSERDFFAGNLGECDPDFLPSEMVAIAKAVDQKEKKAAKERQRKHGGTAPGKHSAKVSLSDSGRATDRVARYARVSGRTLGKAMEVVEAAEADPEKYGPLVEEMDRTRRQNRHRAARMVRLSLL